MDSLNLSVHEVPCIGEVAFNDLKRNTSVEIILVDHINIYDKALEPECLIEVIDHHECKTHFGRNVKVTIDTVGSCSSLVMQRIWEKAPNFQVIKQVPNISPRLTNASTQRFIKIRLSIVLKCSRTTIHTCCAVTPSLLIR